MKAIRIHGPKDARLEDIPMPEIKANEVLIRVKAAGLCGTDHEIYTNDLIYIKDGISKLPILPGHEWSGIVEKTGAAVTKFKIGDKVAGECTISCMDCRYCASGSYNVCQNRRETGIINKDGGFAEYIAFPEEFLHKFENLTFEEAAMIETTGISLYIMERANVHKSDNVLVIGPGAIGLLAAQLAKKAYGSKKVILSGTRDGRLERAADHGLDGVINVKNEDLTVRVSEITNGEMIDVVIETSGAAGIFNEIKNVINPTGRIVVGSFFSKEIGIDLDYFTVRDISIIGSLGSPGVWGRVIELLESKTIEVESVISHILDLEDFQKGIDIMVGRKENVCKIIFNP